MGNRGGENTSICKSPHHKPEAGCRQQKTLLRPRETLYSKAGLLGEVLGKEDSNSNRLLLDYLIKKNNSPNTWVKTSPLNLRLAEGETSRAEPAFPRHSPTPTKRKRTMKLKPEKMPRGSGRQFTAGKTEPSARCGPWAGGGGLTPVHKCLEGLASQVSGRQVWF